MDPDAIENFYISLLLFRLPLLLLLFLPDPVVEAPPAPRNLKYVELQAEDEDGVVLRVFVA